MTGRVGCLLPKGGRQEVTLAGCPLPRCICKYAQIKTFKFLTFIFVQWGYGSKLALFFLCTED